MILNIVKGGDEGGGYPLDGYSAWKVKGLELPPGIFSLWVMLRLKCRPIPTSLGRFLLFFHAIFLPVILG